MLSWLFGKCLRKTGHTIVLLAQLIVTLNNLLSGSISISQHDHVTGLFLWRPFCQHNEIKIVPGEGINHNYSKCVAMVVFAPPTLPPSAGHDILKGIPQATTINCKLAWFTLRQSRMPGSEWGEVKCFVYNVLCLLNSNALSR